MREQEIDMLPLEVRKRNRLYRYARYWTVFLLCGVVIAALLGGVQRSRIAQLAHAVDQLNGQLQGAHRLVAELEELEGEYERLQRDVHILQQVTPALELAPVLSGLAEAARGEVVFTALVISGEARSGEGDPLQYALEIELKAPSTAETAAVISRLQRLPWCRDVELLYSRTVPDGQGVMVERAKVKAVITTSLDGEGA